MIKIQVIGNIGRDAEKRDVSGKSVINFTVAHSEKWKDAQGNQQERTTWVECAYWTEKTGILPYLTKGTMVYVEGAPEATVYTSKDGDSKASLRCRVSQIQLLSRKDATEQPAGNVPTSQLGRAAVDTDPLPNLNNDLPF